MASLLKFLLILMEWAVQMKRRDEYEKKQERLREARTDPAKYLRQFGRVRRKPDESKAVMPDSGTGTDKHDGQ
ncbi:hypothetical protein C0J08_14525 [Marinomonas sp. CT5]|nr:hypothetical protein C0J08_14525 [Marinomonas sp. CT5]